MASPLTGTHVLKIYVTDGAGGSATRQITFTRTVNRIAASRAISTDAKVTKVFLSLYPADHPADATLHVEVTNNPFDTAPVWEDVTSKVGKFVHTFKNTTVAKGFRPGLSLLSDEGDPADRSDPGDGPFRIKEGEPCLIRKNVTSYQ